MNASRPSPAVGFFGRKAHVVVPLLVQKLLGAVGQGAPRHRGDCIDNPAEFFLRRPGIFERFPWNGYVRTPGARRRFLGSGPFSFLRTSRSFTMDVGR